MKKLVMMTEESVFAGIIKCGVAELVDSLANSLSRDYETYIVCPDGDGALSRTVCVLKQVNENVKKGTFSNVTYFLVDKQEWPRAGIDIINLLAPDIFHNFCLPDVITKLNPKPEKTLLTFDSLDFLSGYEQVLSQYSAITTNSIAFANEIKKATGAVAEALQMTNFFGVTLGVLSEFFSPEKGLLLPAKYGADNMEGKQACKKKLQQAYCIPEDACIYLTMCRLVEEKGIDNIIEAIPTIRETNGYLIIIGRGDVYYESVLSRFNKESDRVVFLNKWASPVQAAPFLAGADFYLQPSLHESGGIMPLTASQYGAIPIVTLNGGLADNFDEDNAIIVKDLNVVGAVQQAAELYSNKEALLEKQKFCLEQDYSWTTRKQDYIKLYEE